MTIADVHPVVHLLTGRTPCVSSLYLQSPYAPPVMLKHNNMVVFVMDTVTRSVPRLAG